MKAFITGITGMVGSHLADYLLENTDWEIHGLIRWRSPLDNIEGLIKNIAGGDKEADVYIPLSNTLGFTSEDMTSGDSTNSLLYDDKTFKGALTKGPDNQYSATGGITTPYLDVFGAIQPDGNYSINAGKRFNF